MFPEQQLTLIGKRTVAQDTIEFEFEKPKGFKYKAGQYIGIDLPIGKTKVENIKSFSLSSAPYEPTLTVTMRINPNPYKQYMAKLEKGDKINIQGPFGNFTIRKGDEKKSIFFFAQGIGITPFYSVIKQNIHDKAKQPLMLFYENKTFESTAYSEELAELRRQDKLFAYVPFIPLPMQMEVIDIHPSEKLYFLCGSENAVLKYKQLLDKANIDRKQIRVEEFPGY